MSLSLDKSSLRATLLQQRLLLSRGEVVAKSAAAQAQLLSLPAFQRAKTLALYSPIRNEVETGSLLKAVLSMGKQVCYPRVLDDGIHFLQVQSVAEMQLGRFGILEPAHHSREIELGQLELMLVPGIAFDRSGHRLGYGRGYFDRLLGEGRFNGLSVGFGYDCLIQARLPVESHDQKVALLVTDREIYSPL